MNQSIDIIRLDARTDLLFDLVQNVDGEPSRPPDPHIGRCFKADTIFFLILLSGFFRGLGMSL